jgi:uncharacterized protein (UPF0276 family)
MPSDVRERSGSSGTLGAGVGFKPVHYDEVRNAARLPAFFEVHAENYLGAGGPGHRMLGWLREQRPLSIHGVGLSIGGEEPLDARHLERVAALVARYEPFVFSEHLAWSSHAGAYYADLLPLIYDEDALGRVCRHVQQVQDRLKRRILLENPSTYVEFHASSIPEPQFLSEVLARTGCGLLLDVTNVVVSCTNHGREVCEYLDALPLSRVAQIHLAGHACETDVDGGMLLIDAHDRAVPTAVWSLYRQLLDRMGAVPTLIEWDNDLPEFAALQREADTAEACLAGVRRTMAAAA